MLADAVPRSTRGAAGDAHGDVEARGAAEAPVRGTSTATPPAVVGGRHADLADVVAARRRRRAVSVTSSAMTSTVPRPLRTRRWTGPSVGKRWLSVGMVGLLQGWAAVSCGRSRWCGAGRGRGRRWWVDGGLDGAHHPGVHREALAAGLLLGALLERLGQADGEAGGAAVVAVVDGASGAAAVSRRAARCRHHHLGLAAVHAELDLDVAAGGDLGGQRRQGVEQAEAQRGVEGAGQQPRRWPGSPRCRRRRPPRGRLRTAST